MTVSIIGADLGSDYTKIVWEGGKDVFRSTICHAMHLNLSNQLKNDMIVEWQDEKYFVGDLAVREAFLPIEPRGMNKVREWSLLRLLVGLARNGIANASVVVNQPIEGISKESVSAMTSLLKGEHSIKLNGLSHVITIDKVVVVPESAAAYHSLTEKPHSCRIIDLGSGTINVATVKSKLFINRDSFTINFGVKTAKNNMSMRQIAIYINEQTKANWSTTEKIIVVGGVAKKLSDELRVFFADVNVAPDAQMANAIGCYKIGVAKHGKSR